MNAPVRILVVGLPRLMLEIIENALRDAPELTLVAEDVPATGLLSAIRRHGAEFVIGDADVLVAHEVAAALHALPALRVLTISHDGRTAALHELRPHVEPLGEASAERLVAIIREHAIAPVA